jgi:GMP synthase-like glutamine amidotransferase
MSHGDKLAKLPEGFHTIATTRNSEFAAIGHETKPIYAIQFHPEVTHTIGYVIVSFSDISVDIMLTDIAETDF